MIFVGCSAFSDKIGGNIKGRVQGQREVTACDVVYNLANEKRGRLVDFLLTSIPACRKTLRAENNCVPKEIIGTLTSSILKSVHTPIFPITFYKLYSVATPGHPERFLLENHLSIAALTPDPQRVSFYSVTGFLHHSSTTELILSLITYL